MAERSSDTKAREWLDRLEIRDLVDRYSDAVMRCDWRQCETAVRSRRHVGEPKAGAAVRKLRGIYYDRFARIDGDWKFTRRIFEPVYADMHSVTGDVLTQRSAMLRPD
jgi:hypothetical protein